MKTVCATGHRPKSFPWIYNDKNEMNHKTYLQHLKAEVSRLVLEGYSHFISGGALGVDLDFARVVLDIQKIHPITLEIAIPCPNQDLKWKAEDKKTYADTIAKADKITLVSHFYTKYCMQKRNEYMVNNSDLILAIWNGEENGGTYNTICYAKRQGKEIVFIELKPIRKALEAKLVNEALAEIDSGTPLVSGEEVKEKALKRYGN